MRRIILHARRHILPPTGHRGTRRVKLSALSASQGRYTRSFAHQSDAKDHIVEYHGETTVYALSTPLGVSGVSVIRITGPKATKIFSSMTIPAAIPEPRKANLRSIVDPSNPKDIIDKGIVVYFPGPHSYTGEDVVELQVHGSIAVIRDILSSLQKLEGYLPAEPGDFTKRAWFNSKFRDLTQLEAVADLLRSETAAQRRQAQSQLSGQLGDLYHRWSMELHTCLAHLEALVDFGDDEHLSADIPKKVTPRVRSIHNEIKSHLGDGQRGEILRNGVTVCLAGRPNAGKSSLLNSLSQKDVSIVSPEAGTTRDVVEVRLDLAGFPLILQDTAGVRQGPELGFVEREGITRALSNFKTANIRLILLDLSDFDGANLHPDDESLLSMAKQNPDHCLIVLNKKDLKSGNIDKKALDTLFGNLPRVLISAKSGDGVPALINTLEALVKKFFAGSSFEEPMMTRQRHRQGLEDCQDALQRYFDSEHMVELAAEELRLASRCIQRITGRVDVEQILDIVFRDFCIGK